MVPVNSECLIVSKTVVLKVVEDQEKKKDQNIFYPL